MSAQWEGMQSAEEGDVIGMLLDLDTRTMTVYKNSARLGVMVTGFGGAEAVNWAVNLGRNQSARIDRAEMPADATDEQLAAASSSSDSDEDE